MMNKSVCMLALVIFCSAAGFASTPLWYVDLEKEFPSEMYIKAVGGGAGLEEAKKSAVGELSSWFCQKISMETKASKTLTNQNEDYWEVSVLQQDIVTSSETVLSFVQFSSGYYDKKFDKYFICAFIDRREAWKVLSARMNRIISSYNILVQDVEGETESFYKILAYKNAQNQFDEFEKLYEYALVISTDKCYEFDSFFHQAALNTRNLSVLKENTVFTVSVEGDKNGKINSLISSLAYKNGLTVSDKSGLNEDGSYNIFARIFWNENELNGAFYSEPEIQISINSNCSVVFFADEKSRKLAAYNPKILENMEISALEEILNIWSDSLSAYKGGQYE